MITENLGTLKIKSDLVKDQKEADELFQALDIDFEPYIGQAVGLSAIQINIPKRAFIIRYMYQVKRHGEKAMDEKRYNIWNPEIIEMTQPFVFKGEGCLSFPGKFFNTNRYNQLKIRNGDGKEFKFSGFMAVAIQHEIDHLNGITMYDREAK